MGPRVGHVVVVESEGRDGHPQVVRGRRRYRRPLLRVRLPRRLITGGRFLIRLLRGLLVDLVLLGRGLLVLLLPADSLRGIGPAHRRRPLHSSLVYATGGDRLLVRGAHPTQQHHTEDHEGKRQEQEEGGPSASLPLRRTKHARDFSSTFRKAIE